MDWEGNCGNEETYTQRPISKNRGVLQWFLTMEGTWVPARRQKHTQGSLPSHVVNWIVSHFLTNHKLAKATL